MSGNIEGLDADPLENPWEKGAGAVPGAQKQPEKEHPLLHEVVAPVFAVQLRMVEQNILRILLLRQAVDNDRHGGVQGIEEKQKHALK